ncbi:MAG TPA: type II secretion system protein [Candidatus Paceibacterota bacterium]|nr:type II secretion system protein [Candidatus Paceibacterota bacterium]
MEFFGKRKFSGRRRGFTPHIITRLCAQFISNKKKFNLCGGFTLIELLVVLGITMLLSSILIVYSHSSRQQVALYSERARLAQAIFSAKSFSLGFYKPASSAYCGYGVHIDYSTQTYSIFRYSQSGVADCRKIASVNPLSEEIISTVKADINVKLVHPSSGHWLDDVIFIPPDPVTLVNSNGTMLKSGEADVVVQTLDGSLSNKIGVNTAGLINF